MAKGLDTRDTALGALELVWWWGAAVGVWLITLSSVTTPDLVAATACGLPCALAARAGRRALRNRWRPRPRWALWLAPLAASVIVDEARVLRLALRRPGHARPVGEWRGVQLPAGQPDTVASAHRALASVTISATPGTFVVDGDPEEDRLVIHSLARGWPHLDQVVRR
ncbi:MAG TPA: Na+/H+ antiporter subunit E [Streptosporangiaceae bacterium]